MSSISSIINASSFDLESKSTLLKALRKATGQFKVLAPLSVVSSTTYVVEPEFSFQVKAGGRYILEGNFLVSSATAGGCKIKISAPANTTGTAVISGISTGIGAATVNTTVGLTTGAATSTLDGTVIYANAQVTNGVNFQVFFIPAKDDNISLYFAQNTSVATASILLQGSSANLVEVSKSRRAPNVV